jgi:hypothetical protein
MVFDLRSPHCLAGPRAADKQRIGRAHNIMIFVVAIRFGEKVGHPVVVLMPPALCLAMTAVPIEKERVVVILVVDGVAMFWSGRALQIYLGHVPTLSRGTASTALAYAWSRLVDGMLTMAQEFAIRGHGQGCCRVGGVAAKWPGRR